MPRALVLRFVAACLCIVASSACGSKPTLGSILAPVEGATVTSIALTLNPPALGGSV